MLTPKVLAGSHCCQRRGTKSRHEATSPRPLKNWFPLRPLDLEGNLNIYNNKNKHIYDDIILYSERNHVATPPKKWVAPPTPLTSQEIIWMQAKDQ